MMNKVTEYVKHFQHVKSLSNIPKASRFSMVYTYINIYIYIVYFSFLGTCTFAYLIINIYYACVCVCVFRCARRLEQRRDKRIRAISYSEISRRNLSPYHRLSRPESSVTRRVTSIVLIIRQLFALCNCSIRSSRRAHPHYSHIVPSFDVN